MSTKQAINDKLQESVTTYLRCGGVVNNQIKIRFIDESASEKKLKLVNIWQKLQART